MNQGFILWAKGVNQLNSVTTVAFGENVTLQCFLLEEDNTDPIVWYQQKTGQEPRIMAMTQKSVETSSYYSEFKPPKFTGREFCHLNISSIEPSDEAMYYCGIRWFEIVFGKGALLSVKVKKLYLLATITFFFLMTTDVCIVYVYYRCKWYYFWLYICRM
uniref:Ig-like domain-containing protein n=1 Tax=Electrophorus electricus TaxID=8005 RepID=A0AAY5ETA0_ELEEL